MNVEETEELERERKVERGDSGEYERARGVLLILQDVERLELRGRGRKLYAI